MVLLDDASNPNLRKVRDCCLGPGLGGLTCNAQRTHIVETEPFKDTFGPKAQRKRPRLDVGDFEELSKVGAASKETGVTAEGETSAPGELCHSD